jgi:hypothetical protein
LPTTDSNGVSVAATCHVTRAMLLTFDCEIDNDKKHRLVALIRPLPQDWNEETRTIVRDAVITPTFTCRRATDPWRKAMWFSAHLHPFPFMGGRRKAPGIFDSNGSTRHAPPVFSFSGAGRS